MSKLIAVIATIGALAIVTPVNAASTHIDPFQFSNEFSRVLAAGTNCHMAFDQKKINLFGSWTLTAGNGWVLFWGYVIMAVMMVLVYLLCMVVFSVIAILASGGNVAVMEPIFSGIFTVDMFTQPLYIAYILVLNLLIMPLVMALSLGAPAAAYKHLVGTTKAKVETIF